MHLPLFNLKAFLNHFIMFYVLAHCQAWAFSGLRFPPSLPTVLSVMQDRAQQAVIARLLSRVAH